MILFKYSFILKILILKSWLNVNVWALGIYETKLKEKIFYIKVERKLYAFFSLFSFIVGLTMEVIVLHESQSFRSNTLDSLSLWEVWWYITFDFTKEKSYLWLWCNGVSFDCEISRDFKKLELAYFSFFLLLGYNSWFSLT